MSFSFFDSQPIQYKRHRPSPFDDGPPDAFDDVPPHARPPTSKSSSRRETSLLADALPEMASNDQLLGLEEHGILRHHTLRTKSHEELLGVQTQTSDSSRLTSQVQVKLNPRQGGLPTECCPYIVA